jgi:hypothetical protein
MHVTQAWDRSNRKAADIVVAVLLFAIIMIPGSQCAIHWLRIVRFETSIAAVKRENETLQREIEVLNGDKEGRIADAAKDLGKLDARIMQNQELLEATENAAKKLELVKALIGEHEEITRQLGLFKQSVPELTSGP